MKKQAYTKGQSVCLSIKELYENKEKLDYTKIITEDDKSGIGYYDLYNDNNELACMDGEVCTIKEVKPDSIVLINEDGEKPVYFTLSFSEADIAIFKKKNRIGTESKVEKFVKMIDDLRKEKSIKEIKNLIHIWWLNYQISDKTEQKLLEYVTV